MLQTDAFDPEAAPMAGKTKVCSVVQVSVQTGTDKEESLEGDNKVSDHLAVKDIHDDFLQSIKDLQQTEVSFMNPGLSDLFQTHSGVTDSHTVHDTVDDFL